MERFISVLQRTQLFSGISHQDIYSMLSCLDASLQTFQKGEFVFQHGDQINRIMILVEGKLYVQQDDFWGNRSIIQMIGPGDMFGEAYSNAENEPITVDIAAIEDSKVIFFDVRRMLTVCSSACLFHSTVIRNLFFALSEKNRNLIQKLGHLTKRTTREKLISYLSEVARKKQCDEFTIPFNRQQLADFLSVDRSAMSNELCKLRDEGFLTFDKNHFILHNDIEQNVK